jgi:hypothetical protein
MAVPSNETFPALSDVTCDSNIKCEECLEVKEEKQNVKTEKGIDSEEDESLVIKEEEGINSEEEQEEEEVEKIDMQEQEDVVIQEESCTDPLQYLSSSPSETFPTPSDSTYGVGNIKVEEDVDVIEESFIVANQEEEIGIKEEEVPGYVTFSDLKSEQNEDACNGRFTQQGTEKIQQGIHTGKHTYNCDVCKFNLKNPGGGEIFHTRLDRPWGPSSLLYNGYRFFPGDKAAGAWC